MQRTIEEARVLIESLKLMQEDEKSDFTFPCPRCGHYKMDKKSIRNAISRHADVYICSNCGTDEALLDIHGKQLPLNEWGMVMGYNSEDDITDEVM